MVFDEYFDVIVIGAGHAGCEAASAAARLGRETALITINLDLIGQMSCNPAIGGIAKGHLVREIDALGGIMGRIIDKTGIQFRLLNRSRGLAVQSPRAQADRSLYRIEMRNVLESTSNLHFRQGTVVKLITKNKEMLGVELQDSRKIAAKSVVIATGTFLNGLIHTGNESFSGGRSGESASIDLAQNLKMLNLPIGRLKTGTPPRLDGRTIDWDAFEIQEPDENPTPFSFSTQSIDQPQINCYIGYTNENLHKKIQSNLHQSPLYSGKIKGIGPRYCPSIEDKIVKFADKNRHQLFLEPEGHRTNEVYLNGFSTSLPFGLQNDLLRMIQGFENVQIIRPGYAIEYDFVDPRQLTPSLESSIIKGLFLAGQINGTTGYEEAAAQGLMAGINAAFHVKHQNPFYLSRHEAYIGVLIDDLIKHGADEPYRIFTSRAESRLKLRFDNADQRLSHKGKEIGLLNDETWKMFCLKRIQLQLIKEVLENTYIKRSSPEFEYLRTIAVGNLGDSINLAQLSIRQGIDESVILSLVNNSIKEKINLTNLRTAMADYQYKGYIDNQDRINERVNHYDSLKIPEKTDFSKISGLSNEIIDRLNRTKVATFGQIRSIPGMTPAAISTILISITNNSNVTRET